MEISKERARGNQFLPYSSMGTRKAGRTALNVVDFVLGFLEVDDLARDDGSAAIRRV